MFVEIDWRSQEGVLVLTPFRQKLATAALAMEAAAGAAGATIADSAVP